jgi:hypothetical protein
LNKLNAPRKYLDVRPPLPAGTLPELLPGFVLAEDKEVALFDACVFKRIETGVHQSTAQSFSAVMLVDAEMIEIAAPAVVTAEDGTDYPPVFHRDLTQAGVLPEKSFDIVPFVGGTEADVLRILPESQSLFVVLDSKISDHGTVLDKPFYFFDDIRQGYYRYVFFRALLELDGVIL